MSSFFTKLIETPSERIDYDYVNRNENIILLINDIYISKYNLPLRPNLPDRPMR